MTTRADEFSRKYFNLREFYTDIVELNPSTIEKIQVILDSENQKIKTNKYLVSIIAASLTIILFPLLIVKIFISFDAIPTLIESILRIIPKESYATFNFSFGFGSLVILMYLFYIPNNFEEFVPSKIKKLFPLKDQYNNINKKQTSFVITSIDGVYIVIGLLGFIILLNSQEIRPHIVQFFKYYLFIPISIISFFLLMFLVLTIIILPFRKLIDKKFLYSSNTRIEISIRLLNILDKLKDINNEDLLFQKTISSTAFNLDKVRALMVNYPSRIDKCIKEPGIIEDFEKAADEFEKLTVQLINYQEPKLKSIKKSIVEYLNIFLVGNLGQLPKAEKLHTKKKSKDSNLIQYFFLGVYLVLPILIVIILKISFDLTLDEYVQSLLKILYIIWAFVGLFSNPFTFNEENKEMMNDLIKTILGRG